MSTRAVNRVISLLTRRPMNGAEMAAVNALQRVTFPVGSWDKRFYRTLSVNDTITALQAEQLQRLVYRYRRQIGQKHAALLHDMLTGQKRLVDDAKDDGVPF